MLFDALGLVVTAWLIVSTTTTSYEHTTTASTSVQSHTHNNDEDTIIFNISDSDILTMKYI